jgi:hypothetical protein
VIRLPLVLDNERRREDRRWANEWDPRPRSHGVIVPTFMGRYRYARLHGGEEGSRQIRELVTRLRAFPTKTTERAALRASTDSLRQRLDTARDEITRLRAENDALRDQIARHLGTQRVQPLRHEPGRPG